MARLPLSLIATASVASAHISAVAHTSAVQVAQVSDLENLMVTNFATGVIDTLAVRLEADKEQMYECVEGMEALDDLYQAAMEDLFSKDLSRMLKGIKDLVNLMKTNGAAAARTCQSVYIPGEKLQVITRIIDGLRYEPAHVMSMLFKNVVDNSFGIAYNYIKYSIAKKGSKDYDAGVHMAESIYLVMFGKGTIETIQFSNMDGKALLSGMAKGLVGNFPTLSNCAAEAAKFYPTIAELLHKLETGNVIEKAKAALALEKMYKKTLQPWTDRCMPNEENKHNGDYARLLALFELAQTNPSALFSLIETHINDNRSDVQKSILEGLKAASDSEWDVVGENLGHLISVILFDTAKYAELLNEIERTAMVMRSSRSVVAMDVEQLNLSRDEAAHLLKGIFIGFGSTFDDLWDCVSQSAEITRGITEAIKKLSSHKVGSVKEAVIEIANIIKNQAIPTIQACHRAPADLKKIISALSALSNPQTFFVKVGKNIIVNGHEIFKEVGLAIKAEQNNDFEAMGDAIGIILSKMLVGETHVFNFNETKELTAVLDKSAVNDICVAYSSSMEMVPVSSCSSCSTNISLDRHDTFELVLGLTEGFIAEFTDLNHCVNEALVVVPKLEHAISLLAKKTFAEVREGLKELADVMIHDALPAFKDCKNASSDIKAIIEAFKKLRNPKQFIFEMGRHIIVNGKNIIHEIFNAINAYKVHDLKTFGFNVGLAVKQVVIGHEEMSLAEIEGPKESLKLAESVLHGFLHNSPNADTCLTDTLDIVPKFEHAIQLISQKTFDSVKKGLAEIGQLLHNELGKALTDCKNAVPEVEALIEALKQIQHPTQYSFEIGKHIIMNGRNIIKETNNAINAYKVKDYETFGYNVGLLLQQILIGLSEISDDIVILPLAPIVRV